MSGKYSVPLRKVIKTHSFETIYMPDKPDSELVIRSQDINRPGLLFAGYEKYFDPLRVEFIGLAEMSYLTELDESTQRERLELFFSLKPLLLSLHVILNILMLCFKWQKNMRFLF